MFTILKKFLYKKQIQNKYYCTCQSSCTREVMNEISYQELLEKTKQGVKLIDVRTKQEFIEGHLDGAILIPYYEISRKIQNVVSNKNESIIVYCKNGGRSKKASETLKKLGYTNVLNLKDGIEGVN